MLQKCKLFIIVFIYTSRFSKKYKFVLVRKPALENIWAEKDHIRKSCDTVGIA